MSENSKTFSPASLNISFDFEKEIVDITNPTYEEYKKIEYYLSQITDKGIPKDIVSRRAAILNHFCLVGPNGEMPVSEIVYLNNHPEDRRNCIILYASYNPPYPKKLFKFIEALTEIGFDGHVIYHIGGYPGLSRGLLKLVDIPYAFKYCAFQEAVDLGYQNILWIDSTLEPVQSLQPIFTKLDTQGFFLTHGGRSLASWLAPKWLFQEQLEILNVSQEDASRMFYYHGCIFGINVSSKKGKAFFSDFARYTTDSQINSLTHCSMGEELSLAVSAYKNKCTKAMPLGLMLGGSNRYFQASTDRPFYRTSAW